MLLYVQRPIELKQVPRFKALLKRVHLESAYTTAMWDVPDNSYVDQDDAT